MEQEAYKAVSWRKKNKKKAKKKSTHINDKEIVVEFDSGKFLIPESCLFAAVNMFDPNIFDVTVEDTDLYVPSEEE
jgi:hypothetical protein